MGSLAGKQVLLGVTGGIAAYKAPDLVRRLRDQGAEVHVVMTPAATRFVTPLTFQAVSGHPVRDSLWDDAARGGHGTHRAGALGGPGAGGAGHRRLPGAPRRGHGRRPAHHPVPGDGGAAVRRARHEPADVGQCRHPGQRVTAAGPRRARARARPRATRPAARPAPGACSSRSRSWPRCRGRPPLPTARWPGAACWSPPGRRARRSIPVRYLGNRSSGKMGYAVARAALRRPAPRWRW